MLGDIRPATAVRQIARGEKVVDLTNELKRLTFQSRTPEFPVGLEHAIVSKMDGSRWLVSGGQEGIDFANISDFKRLIVHSHGRPTGPSRNADFPFLINNIQKSSFIVELGNPKIIRFNDNGTFSEFRMAVTKWLF